jgi:hypothetical protein
MVACQEARYDRTRNERAGAVTISTILWDFGNTLADERWLRAPVDGIPSWTSICDRLLCGTDLADRWNSGAIGSAEVAAEFGRVLGVRPDDVLAHLERCSRNVTLYPLVMTFAEQCSLRQVVVTINPEIFTRVVVPRSALRRNSTPSSPHGRKERSARPSFAMPLGLDSTRRRRGARACSSTTRRKTSRHGAKWAEWDIISGTSIRSSATSHTF